jgi:hypothetical protein
MKNKIFFVIFFVCTSLAVNGQERERKFSFQFKPFEQFALLMVNVLGDGYEDLEDDSKNEKIWIMLFDVEFQYAMSDYFTLFLNPQIRYGLGFSSEPAKDYLLISGILYKPFATGLRGFYIGAYPVIGWSKNINNNDKFVDLGFMAEIGYEIIFKKGFTITLGAGIEKIFSLPIAGNKFTYQPAPGNFLGIGLPVGYRARCSMGWSF